VVYGQGLLVEGRLCWPVLPIGDTRALVSMAGDAPAGGPAGPGSRAGQARPAWGSTGGSVPPALDLAFDSGTLYALRAEVQAHARHLGLPESRAADVVLAIHELAANAVRHGAGAGRLRIWNQAGALHCQVDDDGPPASGDPARPADHADRGATEAEGASGRAVVVSRQGLPGHGLWVVRQVADQLQVLSGPRGTRAMVTFDLPRGPGLTSADLASVPAVHCIA
jgi:anti-sigma regulatory factor (Ser/Thr protein kinase)